MALVPLAIPQQLQSARSAAGGVKGEKTLALPQVSQSARGPGDRSGRNFMDLDDASRGGGTGGFGQPFGQGGESMELLRILESHRKECERSGDYESARITRERLGKLRLSQVKKQRKELLAGHKAELEMLTEEQDIGMREFMEVWEHERIPELDECVKGLERELHERQKIELIEFRTRLAAEPYNPKLSPEVLDMARRVDCMGRQEMYAEAKRLKKQIQEGRTRELAKNHAARLQGMKNREDHFVAQQSKEESALRDKIRSIRMEKARQQAREFHALAKQHASSLAYVQARQAVERSRLAQEVSSTEAMNVAYA